MRIIIIISTALVISGCTSSGVMPNGGGSYTVSTSNEMSPAYAKKQAINEESEYCSKKGLAIQPIGHSEGQNEDAFGDNLATFNYNFRCADSENIGSSQNLRRDNNPSARYGMYKELADLAKLRDEGVLTDSEFEIQKKRILSSY